jgi:hypothetical protein
MFYTVHCSIITDENQQNAQIIYIFSIRSTYMFQSCLTVIRVRCYRVSNTMTCVHSSKVPPLDHHTVHSLVHRTF